MQDRAAVKASLKYNLTRDRITAEVIQKYLRERVSRSKKKDVKEREEQIVEFYDEFNG